MRMVQRSALALLFLGTLLVSGAATAQVLLSQQGQLRNEGGYAVDGQYEMLFALYDSPTSTDILWFENHPGVNVAHGVFRVVLGSEKPIPESTFTGPGSLFLGVSVNGEPELYRTRVGRVAFAAVAKYAASAASLSGPIESLECSGCIDAVDLAPGAVTGEKIALGAVQSAHVNFTYAASTEPGGPSLLALDVECQGCVEAEALSFEPATLADVQALAPSLESLGCAVGESPRMTASGWGCAAVQVEGLSNGNAHGYELIDGNGYAWDGYERPKALIGEARAACLSLGGRLPTLGELYRNRNNSDTGVGQSYHGNYLWSGIARDATRTMVVRWSDGYTTHSNNTTKRQYRCVWPDITTDSFTGDHCMGGCYSIGHYNMDSEDRPAMPLVAAIRECAVVNARVPDLPEMENAIRSGLPNGGSWMWTGDQYKGTNNGAPFIVVDWVGTNVSWFPSQNFASTNAYNGAWPDKYYRVRCIGIADRTGLTPPVAGEFVHEAEFVAAHASDQSLVTYLDAIDLCRGAGGHVIDNLEALSLVVGGLPNGSGLGMWTAEHGDLAMLTMYWNDQEPYIWPPNAFVGTGETGFGQDWFSLTSHPYRCIFYATQEWVEPTDCKGNCFVVHQGNSYQALDREDRTPVTYFQAADHCRAFGARLPSTRDLEEAIRLGLPNGTGVGIWSTSSHVSDNSGPPKLVVRWTGSNQFWSPPNDFASGLVGYNSAFPGETKPYRCVWTNEVH